MGIAHRIASLSWLHLPRRTARLRLTALYGGLFLISGSVLVALSNVLFERATESKRPQLPQVPHALAVHTLRLPQLAQLLPQQGLLQYFQNGPLGQAQKELARVQLEFSKVPKPEGFRAVSPQLAQIQHQLTQDENQLTRAGNQLTQGQHQLTRASDQLAQAVHQLAQVAPIEAAQRAVDSHQLLVNSGIALAIVAVLALLAGWIISGRMLRPIRTIIRTARRISSTNLHERLALDGPQDELKELGDTLDDLFGRLDTAFDAQRHTSSPTPRTNCAHP